MVVKKEGISFKTRKGEIFINILFWICISVVALVGVRVFLFSSFKIPSDSMRPSLITGDNILVFKHIPGARIFNLSAALNNKQVSVYRLPGQRKVRHNDVLVFHFPHPNSWETIEMHLMKYYVKRCVGLPGDTLQIKNGLYVNNKHDEIGERKSQQDLSVQTKEAFEEGVYRTFPYDSLLNWNIQHFGPLYIPRKGDTILLNRTHCVLYKKLIEWEQQAMLSYRDSVAYLNNRPTASYRFRSNYYFVAGDRVEDSQDSRYWGLLPEGFIVGKASIIWKSVDPHTGKFRWNRFLKKIN